MNEYCRIGLHSFTDWRDKGKSLVQTRSCRHCQAVEEQQWQPEDRPPPRWRDPYDDLTR